MSKQEIIDYYVKATNHNGFLPSFSGNTKTIYLNYTIRSGIYSEIVQMAKEIKYSVVCLNVKYKQQFAVPE